MTCCCWVWCMSSAGGVGVGDDECNTKKREWITGPSVEDHRDANAPYYKKGSTSILLSAIPLNLLFSLLFSPLLSFLINYPLCIGRACELSQ